MSRAEPDRLEALQRTLADVLLAADPVQALRAARARADADPSLQHIDPDGLRLAALLIVKLRFQRLLNASSMAAQWFEQDPAGFSAAFRRYHTTVPPAHLDPWREAAAFAAWRQQCDGTAIPGERQ